MLLSSVTKYELDMPHDEKVEFTMDQLMGFAVWSVEAYHQQLPALFFNEFTIWRTGEVIRIGDCKGCLNICRVIELTSEMNVLMSSFTIPSEMSIPERTLNSVRYVNDLLGYFDADNESLLPVALKKISGEEKEEYFVLVTGKQFTGKCNSPRYKFKLDQS